MLDLLVVNAHLPGGKTDAQIGYRDGKIVEVVPVNLPENFDNRIDYHRYRA